MASRTEQLIDAAGSLQRAAAASEAALAPYAILGTLPEAPYDDIAMLARDLCATPVALVTLFDTGQQWLKAAIGFEGDRTALGDALCAQAVDADDVVVIPDLSTDPRTRDNALVASGPQARFYAGAPLRLPDGTFLGTLCVIDLVARPTGLAAHQLAGLRALAREVLILLELRRLVNERDVALADAQRALRERETAARQQAAAEAHWRQLFQEANEGFIVGEIIRDGDGRAVDWRYVDVNPAWGRQLGLDDRAIVGRTVREIFPEIEENWVADFAEVTETGVPLSFRSPVSELGSWFDGRVFRIGPDRFACLFLNITDRVQHEQRQAALLTIGDQLRDLDRVEDMTAAVATIVGQTLGASRAGFGRFDEAQQTILMEPGWTAPGVRDIAGLHRFDDYGNLLNELLVGEPLVIDDVTVDPRTAADPAPMQALAIGALVNMPVRERGRTVALYFVHAAGARHWTHEELSFLRDVADRQEAAIGRLELESRRVVQTQEMAHRVKNTLAMVQAIAAQTLKPVAERDAVANFERRLTALAAAHDVLLARRWEASPLEDVVRSVLESTGQDDHVTISGPPVMLAPRVVLSATLLIHELATNAVKYGALSRPGGNVMLSWTIRRQDGRQYLHATWTERGGPPAAAPTRRGFGSRLISMGLVGTGGVELDYGPAGLTAKISAPLDDLTKF